MKPPPLNHFETLKIAAALVLLASIGQSSFAGTVFEGYYKVEKAGQHKGFLAVREEFDASAKHWTTKYTMQIVRPDGRIFQTHTTLEQDAKLHPISAEYEEWGNGTKFRVEMSAFTDKSFHSHTVSGGITRDREEPFAKDEFFLSALNHRLPFKTMKVGSSYSYMALRDEAATVKYKVKILNSKIVAGKKVFQVVDENPWRREEYWIAEDGQVLHNRLPAQDMTLTLEPSLEAAAGFLNYDREALARFFGETPKGVINSVAQHKISTATDLFDIKMAEVKPAVRATSSRAPASVETAKLYTGGVK